MKTYNIELSISGETEYLQFLHNVMAGDPTGYDFINLSMDIFSETFAEHDPYLAPLMVSGVCEVNKVDYTGNTVEMSLNSKTPVPYGWLHSFDYAFDKVEFTAHTVDEQGEDIVIQFEKVNKQLDRAMNEINNNDNLKIKKS